MNLRDLEYFVAVAELGHFGKAADRCFCTQPTLSGQLRKLEDELGSPLFERMPQGVRLTALGSQCLGVAREALAASRRILDLGRAARDPEAGDLLLAAIPTIGPYLWPSLLHMTRGAFPQMHLLLREEQTRVLLESLRAGKVDAGVLALPLEGANLEIHPLWEEPFVLAVGAEHPLAGRNRASLEDLDGLPILLLEEGHCLREQALEVCRLHGAWERDGFRATSLETLRQLVRSGMGATLLPASAAEPATDLVLIPFVDPPVRTVGLVHRKGHPRSGVFPRLAEAMRHGRPF
ncbi:MAG TPA: LysR substrate-binding domain-containing protein [Fibrobacteria bacterium]|nr:LysR substrate-binding domain-containing protein [Fibrobacteria bacterium]HOX50606.1 LysR substrate-binding domain-containing protein [Fibrobacteria bacterium]